MNTTNETTLLPCPFCGEQPFFKYIDCGVDKWLIECRNLECKFAPFEQFKDEAQAVLAWNTRTPISNDVSMESSKSNALSDVNDTNVADIKDAVEMAAYAIWKRLDPKDEIAGMGLMPFRFYEAADVALKAAYPALVKERDALISLLNNIEDSVNEFGENPKDCLSVIGEQVGLYHHYKTTKGGA